MDYLLKIWRCKELRNKILFTLGAVVVIRFAAIIPVPGTNVTAIRSLLETNSFLGAFAMLTGGSLSNFSIILMGVSPYINASIILQLMTVVVPRLEQISKEGEKGRMKINSLTRWLTLPLAFMQSYGMILLLNQLGQGVKLIEDTSFLSVLPLMVAITAGTIFIVWLGEIMTEYGIGNGVSIIIFASIVAGIPNMIGQQLVFAEYDATQLIPFIITVILTFLLTSFVVLVTEGQRNIPVTYAGRTTQGGKNTSFIPIRVNQAGMIPIIFAVSMVTFPQVISSFFIHAKTAWVQMVAQFIQNNFNATSWWYAIALFVFVFLFTFFYVSITFNPEQVAENIQKRGGFVTGIRPGKNTVEFLKKTSLRLNLWGGAFLGFISIVPFIINSVFTELSLSAVPLLIGGAGMIIIVGVVIEIMNQIKTNLIMHDYDSVY